MGPEVNEDPDPWCEEADGEYEAPAVSEDHIEVQDDYLPDRWGQ